jgi:hypothetical protein
MSRLWNIAKTFSWVKAYLFAASVVWDGGASDAKYL